MNPKKIFAVMMTLVIATVIVSVVPASAQFEPTAESGVLADTIYKCDFEYGWSGWWADNGVWEVGHPDTIVVPHSGDSCAGTVLNNNYPDKQNSHLISPPVNLPDTGLNQALRLRFWHWFKIHSTDRGRVQISVDLEGVWQPWETISNIYGVGSGVGSSGGIWSAAEVEISKYAGKRVCFGFYLTQDSYWSGTAWGWYIDDVCVIRTPACVSAPVCLDFEEGWGDWWVDNGVWEIGHPDTTVVVPHSGQNCAGTVLNGNYSEYMNTRLVSPAICLSNIDAGNEGLYLGFWHWFKIHSTDRGRVQISVDSGGVWQPWATISTDFTGTSAIWSPVDNVNISKYAGKGVRFGFYLSQDSYWSGTAWGWYVDDACVTKRPDTVTVLNPNGGECWEIEVAHTINWNWQDWSGTFQYVDIELSRDAGKTWETLIDSTSNNGFWQGIIEDPASDKCLIRISDATDGVPSDVSDSLFSIGEVVTVTSPNGGEIWHVGSTYSITWTSCFFTGEIKLEYSTNNGADWMIILPSTENDGSEDWEIPNASLDTCLNSCLVTISDAADGIPADTSDSLFTICPQTGVDEDQKEQKLTFSLSQNFPNPFNPNTSIQFSLPTSGEVSLKIYNLLGQEVTTLIDEEKRAGEHEVLWDGRDNFGNEVASGIYFYQLKVRDFSEAKKLILLK